MQEHRQLPLVVRGVEIEPSVVVIVAAVDAHVGEVLSVEIDRRARDHRDFLELSPPVVVEEEIRLHVVADEKVGVAVVVVVGRDHSHVAAGAAAMPEARLTSVNVPSPLLRYKVPEPGVYSWGDG